MGVWEILIILVVALVLLGPRQLSRVASYLGKALGYFQGVKQTLQSEVDKQLKQTQLEENIIRAEAAELHSEQQKNNASSSAKALDSEKNNPNLTSR